MPKRSQLTILPFSLKQLFDLVMDIKSYPEFLPWCIQTNIIEKHENFLIADMLIGYHNFSGKYRSRVEYKFSEETAHITVSLLEGPFRYLNNKWIFTKLDGELTRIKFDIDFSFKSVILEKMVGFVFDTAFKKIMKSFEKRAHYLYKK